MAKLTKYVDPSLSYFKDSVLYNVDGYITLEDVEKINNFPENVVLLLKNTCEQNSEIIKKITSNKVTISVIGGLDYLKKKKYKGDEYIQRTLYKANELSQIISFFEMVERNIRYSWSSTQKCMYVYECLVNHLHYWEEDEKEYIDGFDVTRSLRGILYGRMVCAGFSLIFKEMMDRIGIPCLYQNIRHKHSWNIVELDNKSYGVDITWDCASKNEHGKCDFLFFGTIEDFYNDPFHDLSSEKDEKKCKLSIFSTDDINKNVKVIHLFTNRESMLMNFLSTNDGEKLYYKIFVVNKNITTIITYYDNEIHAVYIDKKPEDITDIDILNAIYNNGYNISDLRNSPKRKLKKYIRNDGTEFFIFKIKNLNSSISEFYYIEITTNDDGEVIYDSRILLSEMNLDEDWDSYIEAVISNELLSRDRVALKNEYFRGYVGYLKNKNIHFSEKFEKKLGIIRHY